MNDSIEVLLYDSVVELEKPHTQSLRPPLPRVVLRSLNPMTVAIDLHREHWLGGKEIDDVLFDRLLPVEIDAAALAAFAVPPW